MTRWFYLLMMPVMLLAIGSYGASVAAGAQVTDTVRPPAVTDSKAGRFSKAANGVITDSVTGLEWYVRPSPDNTWGEAKAWAANLTVDGGGWRLPTMAELKGIYQKDASRVHMDPLFEPQGAWVWSGELRNEWSAWGLAFYNGLEGWHSVNYGSGRLAFAVRSRQ